MIDTPADDKPRPLSLASKAEMFHHDLLARFVFGGQVAPKLKVPTPQRPFPCFSMPDSAYMTGIYTGMLAMKFQVTADPDVRREAVEALGALDLLCNVSGARGVLARAAVAAEVPFDDDGVWVASPDGHHKWRCDVSSDQVDGVMFGYALVYDALADEAQKAVIAKNTASLVGAILDNGMRILDHDGRPTRWGDYTPEYCRHREPINALLMLQHLKVAHHVTGDDRLGREYHRVARDLGYARIAIKARRMGDPLKKQVNYSDDVLMWLAYFILLKYETEPDLRECYLESLRRTWMGADGYPGIDCEGNPLYAFLVCQHLGLCDSLPAALKEMRLFPMDMKWNRSTLADYERQFGFRYDPTPTSPAPSPGQVVPIDRRPKYWSAWVHSPYVTGDRRQDEPMEFTGLEYLLAYWMGRATGCIDGAW